DRGLRNDSAGIETQRFGVERSGSRAGRGDPALLRQFFRREIAVALAGGWDRGAQQAGIQHLVEILKSGKEEELLAILVQFGERQHHRTADVKARIVILIFRPWHPAVVGKPVVGVQYRVSRSRVQGTMEIPAAALGN